MQPRLTYKIPDIAGSTVISVNADYRTQIADILDYLRSLREANLEHPEPVKISQLNTEILDHIKSLRFIEIQPQSPMLPALDDVDLELDEDLEGYATEEGVGGETFQLSIGDVKLPEVSIKLSDEVIKFAPNAKNWPGMKIHQIEAAERALEANSKGHGYLMMDDAGVGKTNAALGCMKYYLLQTKTHNDNIKAGKPGIIKDKEGNVITTPVFRKYLVVLPKKSKENLKEQWLKSAPLFSFKLTEINYENMEDVKKSKTGTYITSYDEITMYQLQKSNPGFFFAAFDECQEMKNPDTTTTLYAAWLQQICEFVVYMSASPFPTIEAMHYLFKLGIFNGFPYEDVTQNQIPDAVSVHNWVQIIEFIKAQRISFADLEFMIKNAKDYKKSDFSIYRVNTKKMREIEGKSLNPYAACDHAVESYLEATRWSNKHLVNWRADTTRHINSQDAIKILLREPEFNPRKNKVFQDFLIENGATKEVDLKSKQEKIIVSENEEYVIALHVKMTMLGYGIKRLANLKGLKNTMPVYHLNKDDLRLYSNAYNLYVQHKQAVARIGQGKGLVAAAMAAQWVLWNRLFSESLKCHEAIKIAKEHYENKRQIIIFLAYNKGGTSFMRAIHGLLLKNQLEAGLIDDTEYKKVLAYFDKMDAAEEEITKDDPDPAKMILPKRPNVTIGGMSEYFFDNIGFLPTIPPPTKTVTEALGNWLIEKHPKDAQSSLRAQGLSSDLKKAKPFNVIARIYGNVKGAGKDKDLYNDGVKKILVSNMAKGATGLSYHDETGLAPRTQINVTLPWEGISHVQLAGRSHRLGSKSKTQMIWIITSSSTELYYGARLFKKLRSLNAGVSGDPLVDEVVQKLGDMITMSSGDVELTGEQGAAISDEIDPEAIHEHYVKFYLNPDKFRDNDDLNDPGYFQRYKDSILQNKRVRFTKQKETRLIFLNLGASQLDETETQSANVMDVNDAITDTLKDVKEKLVELQAKLKLNSSNASLAFDVTRYLKAGYDKTSIREPRYKFPEEYYSILQKRIVLGRIDPSDPYANPPRILITRIPGSVHETNNPLKRHFLNIKSDEDIQRHPHFVLIMSLLDTEVINAIYSIEELTRISSEKLVPKRCYFAIRERKENPGIIDRMLSVPHRRRNAGKIDVNSGIVYPALESDTNFMLLIFDKLVDLLEKYETIRQTLQAAYQAKLNAAPTPEAKAAIQPPTEEQIFKEWKRYLNIVEKARTGEIEREMEKATPGESVLKSENVGEIKLFQPPPELPKPTTAESEIQAAEIAAGEPSKSDEEDDTNYQESLVSYITFTEDGFALDLKPAVKELLESNDKHMIKIAKMIIDGFSNTM